MDRDKSTFWLSYSDLLTSLFFIMLVMFIVAVIKVKVIGEELNKTRGELTATDNELEKIQELYKSIQEIDTLYFEYDDQFKRHTLKNIVVSFNKYSSDIRDIDIMQRTKLLNAGKAIIRFMQKAKTNIPEAQYLLIVEGQSSKDNYQYNYELSYSRALALINFWSDNGIEFGSLDNCEILISGSGQNSRFRVQPDIKGNENNQRFVIHIIPKPGIIRSEGKNK